MSSGTQTGKIVQPCGQPQVECRTWAPWAACSAKISKTWAGCPLRTFDLALHYIGQTKTQAGLRVRAYLVTEHYATGVKVSNDEMATLNLQRHDVCPQWNYTIRPRTNPSPH